MSQTAVLCHQLNKSFDGRHIVKNLSFSVEAGQIVTLLGPSGCGKTTTLRLIAGFETLDSGRIDIAGQTVADYKEHVPPEKRRIGMVFQDYAIFPHLSVAKNIAFGLERGVDSQTRTAQLLQLVGLGPIGQQMPHELSGGQQQRVALARALARKPSVLLLDEPFSNLDTGLRTQVRAEVRQLLKETAVTALFVTHDQEEALYIGDQVAVMRDGRLEQLGSPHEIFHQPATRFVAEFMGETDFLPATVTANGLETRLGKLPQRVPLPAGTQVNIALRADDVAIEATDEPGNARVIERRFIGIANIYILALNDGTQIRSWQPHTRHFPLGSEVQAIIQSEHPLACFYNDKAVS